jgi:hypothetical protein
MESIVFAWGQLVNLIALSWRPVLTGQLGAAVIALKLGTQGEGK